MQSVICHRCNTTNEFYVVESGPHLKAICNNCDRYIKFISRTDTSDAAPTTSKTPAEGLNQPRKKMGNIISMRIDVTKIDKKKLYVGEKGTYLDIVALMKDEADQYGNHGMIVQQVTKEERIAGVKGAILGNAKILGGGNSEGNPQGGAPAVAKQAAPAPSDLPF